MIKLEQDTAIEADIWLDMTSEADQGDKATHGDK